jgi:hypothetical protein
MGLCVFVSSRYSDTLRAGRRRFDFRQGKILFLLHSIQTTLEPTQPPTERVLRALSAGEKFPEREADQSPPPSAGVKNAGAIPPLTHTSS